MKFQLMNSLQNQSLKNSMTISQKIDDRLRLTKELQKDSLKKDLLNLRMQGMYSLEHFLILFFPGISRRMSWNICRKMHLKRALI